MTPRRRRFDFMVVTVMTAHLLASCAPSSPERIDSEVGADVAMLLDEEAPMTDRLAAAGRLGETNPPLASVLPSLFEALDQPHRPLKAAVAQAIASIGPAALPQLLDRMDSDDVQVREYATFAVLLAASKHEVRSAGPAVLHAVNDEDYRTRSHAIRALWYVTGPDDLLDDAAVIEVTIRALDDDYYAVRQAAAFQLGWRQVKEAVPELKRRLKDPHPMVKSAAYSALKDIGSEEALAALADAGL